MKYDRDMIKAWVQASRPPFFIATFIPLIIGWILGAENGSWHISRFILVVIGAFMVHLATNLANDYFDHVQGTDAGESIGGSRVIQEGKISPEELFKAILLCYLLASLVAFYFLFILKLWALLPFLLLALFSSYFYVAPPIKYGYHGLGELFVGVNMGPVMVVGTYWVIAGRPDWVPFFISIPVGLMVAVILYYQSLPDMRTDEAVGKYTLAVRLGKRRAFHCLILFWIAVYVSILCLIFLEMLHPMALLSLITVPLFVKLLRIVRKIDDWMELDGYGNYIRILYLSNGLIIIFSLLF